MKVTEVIEKASKSFGNLQKTIGDLDSQVMAIPETLGLWSVKDVLNHLTIWEEEAANAFEIWKVGIEPDWSHIEDLDRFNNETVAERRKIALSKVRGQLEVMHRGVLENIKSVPNEEYAKRGGVPRWLIILITQHIDEHTARINEFKQTLEMAERQSA
jgi:hypothetical protein